MVIFSSKTFFQIIVQLENIIPLPVNRFYKKDNQGSGDINKSEKTFRIGIKLKLCLGGWTDGWMSGWKPKLV